MDKRSKTNGLELAVVPVTAFKKLAMLFISMAILFAGVSTLAFENDPSSLLGGSLHRLALGTLLIGTGVATGVKGWKTGRLYFFLVLPYVLYCTLTVFYLLFLNITPMVALFPFYMGLDLLIQAWVADLAKV